jgi:uncharacterized protein YecE (DUF72 family)
MLFGDDPVSRARAVVGAAPHAEHIDQLAAAMPRHIRLGTSSWSYPGWRGLVYRDGAPPGRLARQGLAAYCDFPLFRTVGIDHTFYTPPNADELARLAAQTPADFRFVAKAHQIVTRPFADEEGQTFGDTAALAAAGRPNPRFLDAAFATDAVVAPTLAGLQEKAGVVLLQFPPLDLTDRGPHAGAAGFIDALGDFLSRLPRPPRTFIAVEVRNRQVLSPEHAARYAAALHAGRAVHCFVSQPALPTVAEQARVLTEAGAPLSSFPGVFIRWLLHHRMTEAEGRVRYDPFNRIVDADEPTRTQIARLAGSTTSPTFITVTNVAEGSAPLSIVRLAEEIVGRPEAESA